MGEGTKKDGNEKTKICKQCQSEIPVKAKICPQCRKKQSSKGKWIAVILVAIVVISIIASGSDDDKDEPKKVGEVSNSIADTSGNTDSNSRDVKENSEGLANDDNGQSNGQGSDAQPENGFGVGDIVETDKLKITFLSAQDYVSDNQFIQPKEGFKFIRAEFEFENIGNSDEHVSEFSFNCYADGYDMEACYFDFGEETLSATLSAGRKTKGSVFYEVPTDAQEIILEYETNFWTEKKIVFYFQK